MGICGGCSTPPQLPPPRVFRSVAEKLAFKVQSIVRMLPLLLVVTLGRALTRPSQLTLELPGSHVENYVSVTGHCAVFWVYLLVHVHGSQRRNARGDFPCVAQAPRP